MIRAIIFDVGGVLLRTEDHEPRRDWEAKLGLSAGELEQVILNSKQGKAAQLGQVTEEEHWQWVRGFFQLGDAEAERLRQDFWRGDQLDRDLVQLIRQLSKRYQTAIISNYMDGLRQELTEVHQIADAFDLIIVSSEVGIVKPDPRIFRLTLEQLGREPSESIFIDDFPKNVEGARRVGMHGILFDADLDLPASLSHLGADG